MSNLSLLLNRHSNQNGKKDELNHQAVALLLAHTLKKQKPQTFAVAGSEDLRALLPKLHLKKEHEEAFILYHSGSNSMALYFRVENEKLQVFFFAPQLLTPQHLSLNYLKTCFPNARIVLSSDAFSQISQADSTQYSLHFLDYCAAQGGTWFQNYANNERCEVIAEGIEKLKGADLPQELLRASNRGWHAKCREKNHETLEQLLLSYMNSSKTLNHSHIYQTVQEMQGVDLPVIHIDGFLKLTPKLICEDGKVIFTFSSKAEYLENNDILSCLLDGHPEVKLLAQAEQLSITLTFPSHQILLRAFDSSISSLGEKHINQQGALLVLQNHIESTIALTSIARNKSGGFDQNQVQLALQNVLSESKAFIPSIDTFSGENAVISLSTLLQQGYNSVAFAYQSSPSHQIGVWITLDEGRNEVRLYNSLPGQVSDMTKNRLRQLLCLQPDTTLSEIVLPLPKQADDWSCGAHVFRAVVHLAINQTIEASIQDTARFLFCAYAQQVTKNRRIELEKANNREKTQFLLHTIEQYREELLSPSEKPNDLLRPLADYLQVVFWGNLDRRPLASEQKGRRMEASEFYRGLSFSALLKHAPPLSQESTLILTLAKQCKDITQFDWKALFVLMSTASILGEKFIKNILLFLEDELSHKNFTIDEYENLIRLLLKKPEKKGDVLIELLKLIFDKDELADYQMYIERQGAFAHENSLCYALIKWLVQQRENCLNTQWAVNKRMQNEEKAKEQELDACLKSLGFDEEKIRQEFLAKTWVTSAFLIQIYSIPQEQFLACDKTSRISFIHFLIDSSQTKESEVDTMTRAAKNLPLKNKPFLTMFLQWVEKLLSRNHFTKKDWKLLRFSYLVDLLKNDELDDISKSDLHKSLNIQFAKICQKKGADGAAFLSDLLKTNADELDGHPERNVSTPLVHRATLSLQTDKLTSLSSHEGLEYFYLGYRISICKLLLRKDITALINQGFFTIKDLLECTEFQLSVLLKNDITDMIGDGHLLLGDIRTCPEPQLRLLTSQHGIQVLKKERLSIREWQVFLPTTLKILLDNLADRTAEVSGELIEVEALPKVAEMFPDVAAKHLVKKWENEKQDLLRREGDLFLGARETFVRLYDSVKGNVGLAYKLTTRVFEDEEDSRLVAPNKELLLELIRTLPLLAQRLVESNCKYALQLTAPNGEPNLLLQIKNEPFALSFFHNMLKEDKSLMKKYSNTIEREYYFTRFW